MNQNLLHPDRLLPADPALRPIAKELYISVKNLPILSPHGHTDPSWFALNENFKNPTELLITPDHYVFRMLYSQGVDLEALGIGKNNLSEGEQRSAWRLFAENYHLFRGTPSQVWLNHVFFEIFGLDRALTKDTAEFYFDHINEKLKGDDFKPRALFDRFNIEAISTTDEAYDDLSHHQTILDSDWKGRVLPCFRPDRCIDPEHEDFLDSIKKLGEVTGEDTTNFDSYLNALRNRREFFRKMGATATDHGHPEAFTCKLSKLKVTELFEKCLKGDVSKKEAKKFRGHMLIEMAKMSVEDGLVMQLHPGSYRNHNQSLFESLGRDKGHDIPRREEYTKNLRPLLNEVGNEKDFTFIIFTLDETTYSRELAPLAGHYPALKLGPAWWFHDSPEGMKRFREMTTETAGFYNTVGFNDDTRAFLSIPARHDLARRMDAGFLARLVCEHRITDSEAHEIIQDLTYNLCKKAYKL